MKYITLEKRNMENKFKVEDIIEYKGKKYDVVKQPIIVGIETLNQKTLKKFDTLIFLKEHKEEILDEEEKKYLSSIIKPYGRFITIEKRTFFDDECFIEIKIRTDHGENIDYDIITLPSFDEIETPMYKGMKHNIIYTLEELGL